MSIKFYNTKSEYGDSGPFKAENKEEIAKIMLPLFRQWAIEAGNKYGDTPRDENGAIAEEWIEQTIHGPEGYEQDFLSGLEPQWHGKPRVIFDNGGGVTVQLPKWAHWYNDPAQAVEDVRAYIAAPSVAGWDGNEPEAVFEPTDEQIRNGGYRIWMVGDDPLDCTWGNVTDFFAALNREAWVAINPQCGIELCTPTNKGAAELVARQSGIKGVVVRKVPV